MNHSTIRSIINNTFLPNQVPIKTYFDKNNKNKFFYNKENIIPGGFTLNFCPSDDRELFEQNLKTQPEDWYYRTHEVKYTLNSFGYRTKEFDDIDWKESIVVFGCSLVFGIGVTDENTIPYFLEKLSGRPVINMGFPGGSIQTVLHNSIILNDSKYPTPKAVVNEWPGMNRHQLYLDNSTFNFGEWNHLSDQKFLEKENLLSFNLMNIKMIRNLWRNETIYYEGTLYCDQVNLINALDNETNAHFYQSSFPEIDGVSASARDLQHCGLIKNFETAKSMYEKLKPHLEN